MEYDVAPRQYTIAIDYDGTFTAMPDLWTPFLVNAQNLGHRAICVTMRYEDTEGVEVKEEMKDVCDEIIFTERHAKIKFLADMGIYPDIWIDDEPHFLFQNG